MRNLRTRRSMCATSRLEGQSPLLAGVGPAAVLPPVRAVPRGAAVLIVLLVGAAVSCLEEPARATDPGGGDDERCFEDDIDWAPALFRMADDMTDPPPAASASSSSADA